jgi:hypothetical protein
MVSWVDVLIFQKNVTASIVWVVSWEKEREMYGFFILGSKMFYWFGYHNM